MRYLAILLLAPWLLVLGWAYFAYPKSLPRTAARRSFDTVALLLAAVASIGCAVLGFEAAVVPQDNEFGRRVSGAIWQQVLPALNGYGVFIAVLALAMLLRYLIWRRPR
ncbi:hypothetical protein ASG87_09955 [Frateuria sp. Soil773]|uniref:hypothetical protein n=1 Tax=Frateuria sp. Soil773 TaxID=1736407 RepID=UPI0006F7CA40|nr:hypothetical protein [Frateuria sp. Soil773]KRF01825.1 hypothetical protein ASG87_09955 [Frateuria sp. Soil773]